MTNLISKISKSIVVVLLLMCSLTAFGNPFVVVIDAGHGGKDPGAVGIISQEKKINLDVSLLLGELIQKNYPDVKIIYTRKTDKYLTLHERAAIANKAHADLFISIHANANDNKTISGSETYTLGLARSNSNLEVAMRENAVILLEEDYKQKYAGFDPKSIDSYIMFECIQDRFMDKSIQMASDIQKGFSTVGRANRGVRQAGFLVLRETAMPSVLVELGFISNKAEEQYMNSKSGQQNLAQCIFSAFEKFKKEHNRKTVVNEKNEDKEQNTDTELKDQIVFKIQIIAVREKIKKNSSEFKGLKDVDFYKENNWIKYTYGSTTSYEEIKKMKEDIADKFPNTMIVAFKNGVKIPIKEALNKK